MIDANKLFILKKTLIRKFAVGILPKITVFAHFKGFYTLHLYVSFIVIIRSFCAHDT